MAVFTRCRSRYLRNWNKSLIPDLKSIPADMPEIYRKVLEKPEEIQDACPVKFIPDAIYDTCDYIVIYFE
jgi:hypothetical protein